jgi:nitroreductase
MDALEAIMTRRSIRTFIDKRISDDAIRSIMEAGMSGPSCANTRPWSFLLVRDKTTLSKMADSNGRYAEPLRYADAGILVCGDMGRAFKPAPDYWIIDCAIAAQNIVLAATALGIGSVWLGTYPQMDRVEKQSRLFDLPVTIKPHSIIALGYPDSNEEKKPSSVRKYEPKRVHEACW